MAKPNQYSVKSFIEAINGSGGIISTIAIRVGCTWHTAKKYIDTYPTIKQAYEDECERITDLAESKLFKAIENGDLQAVKYYLSTKGKHRGYTERQELTGKNGGPVEIKNVDITQLTDEQLERIARGEDVRDVIADQSAS